MSWTSCCRRLAAALAVAVLAAGCGEEAKPLLQVGEKATPFALELVDGRSVELQAYAGRSLVVTFMSSWCPCSNQSLPLLKQVHERHRNDPVAFLLIGIQDSRSNFRQFVGKWNVPFQAGYDKGDRIARDYGVSAPPTTFFIGRDGVVKRAFYGDFSKRPDEFRQWVAELI